MIWSILCEAESRGPSTLADIGLGLLVFDVTSWPPDWEKLDIKGVIWNPLLDRGYNTIKHCDKTAKTVLAVLSQLF